MRFPLLVSASPSAVPVGPKVLLRAGKWKVNSDHRDSVIHLYVDGVAQKLDQIVEVSEPTAVWVTVPTAGREKEINIFLESV